MKFSYKTILLCLLNIGFLIIVIPECFAEWNADLGIRSCYHPILKFSTGSPVSVDNLSAETFSSLNGLYLDPHATDFWRDDMYLGELKVLESARLNEIVKGRSKIEVLKLIGAPGIFTRQLPDRCTNNDDWLYFMGYCRIGVCVSFSGDVCTGANVCPKELRRALETRAFQDIQEFAPGKSKSEIYKHLRCPQTKSEIDLRSKQNEFLGTHADLPSTFRFDVGDDYEWNFEFDNNHCTSVSSHIILH